MNRSITLIIYFICAFFINDAIAQDNLKNLEAKATQKGTKTFNIVSLDGKNEKVKIIPDYVNSVLKITCMKDTITIPDFWKVQPEINLLNKNFIEIRYAVRGGTGIGLGNTLILCVNGSKLYEAMHVLRYINGDSGDLKNDYHIELALNGDSNDNYKLRLSIHDDVFSKRKPNINYVYNNQTVLSFDTKQNAFYSIKEDIYDRSIKSGNGKKQKVNGNYPVIILGKQTYYFINNRWHQSVNTKELYEI